MALPPLLLVQWFNDAQPEVVAACRAALSRLEALGATIHSDLVLPELEELRVAHVGTIVSEIHATFAWMLEDRYVDLGRSNHTAVYWHGQTMQHHLHIRNHTSINALKMALLAVHSSVSPSK